MSLESEASSSVCGEMPNRTSTEADAPKRRYHKGYSPWNKGLKMAFMPKSEEWKRNASLSKRGARNPMKNPIYAAKMAASKRGRPNPKHKAWWAQHKDEQIRRMRAGTVKKPNSLELKMIGIMKSNSLPFEYTGDWKVTIGGRCPDFLGTSDKGKAVDLFGEYWHTVKARETPEQRIDYFKRHGTELLIVWEHELADEGVVIRRIADFIANGTA